jgi:phage shock protein PspC (stress-responsive transcriptional regulator)
MTQPTPPPRRLMRSSRDRYLGGVCGGLAQYLNVDATLIRLVAVVLTLSGVGLPAVLYLIALLLVPEGEQPGSPTPPRPPVHPPSAAPGPAPTPPAPPSGGPGDPIWGSEGAPWEQPQPPQPGRPGAGPTAGPDTPQDPS